MQPIDGAFPDALSSAELDELAKQITEAEDAWLRANRATTTSMICSACGGRGEMSNGSLGTSECFECNGSGAVEDDFADSAPLELPAGLRSIRSRYQSLRDVAQRGALPPAAEVHALLDEVKPYGQAAKQAVKEYRSVPDPRDEQIAALQRRLEALEAKQLDAGEKTAAAEPDLDINECG